MATEAAPEEEIDYSWHPSEEEFSSPITSDMWQDLLRDDSFTQTDAYQAVVCLKDFGEPATFQQLSIRYRAAMGRYRRWLSEAAQTACRRFGVEAPSKDQFGMDEWWPVLYQTRSTGKPGAGIFEMQLRDEVLEAFDAIDQEQRRERRAENARQLQRIEQLERQRQEERARAARATQQAATPKAAKQKESQEQKAKPEGASVPKTTREKAADVKPAPKPPVAAEAPVSPAALPSVAAFMDLVDHPWVPENLMVANDAFDGTVDYAERYSSRLQKAMLELMLSDPSLTEATIARGLGDETVKSLQTVLSGKELPSFSYLDRIQSTFYIGVPRLEAADVNEEAYPLFVTYGELFRQEVAEHLAHELGALSDVCYVVEDGRESRTLVVLGFGPGRACLLTRVPVCGENHGDEVPEFTAFVSLVDEIDAQIKNKSVRRTSTRVPQDEFAELMCGNMWPGTLLP